MKKIPVLIVAVLFIVSCGYVNKYISDGKITYEDEKIIFSPADTRVYAISSEHKALLASTENTNKVSIMVKKRGAFLTWAASIERDFYRYNVYYGKDGGELSLYNSGEITVGTHTTVYRIEQTGNVMVLVVLGDSQNIPPEYQDPELYVFFEKEGPVLIGTLGPEDAPVTESYYITKELEPGFYEFKITALDYTGNESGMSGSIFEEIPEY